MKLNIMGYSVPKKGELNEVGAYNTTVSYQNINNNPFFTMSISNQEQYKSKNDCAEDKTYDVDVENYKIKRYFFKTTYKNNFYVLDRENYLYPVEYKNNFHVSINEYIKTIGTTGKDGKVVPDGIFIVTERKIGNPCFYKLKNKSYLENKVRNVYTGKTFVRQYNGNYVEDYIDDLYSYKTELNKNPALRRWKNVIQYYVQKPELLTTSSEHVDVETLRRVHALFTSNISGSEYLNTEKPHVKFNNMAENTISFISVEFIPLTELIDSKYISDYDIFIVPEDQLNELTVHPYSEEGIRRRDFEKEYNKNTRKYSEDSENYEVVIYSKTHFINNMCFYTKILGEKTTIVPKKEDEVGESGYIQVRVNKKGNLNIRNYDLTVENLKLLEISLNEDFDLLKAAHKEKMEIDKINLEVLKINQSMKNMEIRGKVLDINNKDQLLNFYLTLKKRKEDMAINEAKLRNELLRLEYDAMDRDLDLREKILDIRRKDAMAENEMEVQRMKYNKEKITGVVTGITNLNKLLDSLEFFVSKFILKV